MVSFQGRHQRLEGVEELGGCGPLEDINVCGGQEDEALRRVAKVPDFEEGSWCRESDVR